MRIAILISGRAARYEMCLLPILQECKYDCDLFMSINDEDCEYYNIMREKLQPWLKGIEIKQFTFPNNFTCIFNDDFMHHYQKIDDKWLPRNQLSMYWNDHNSFSMASKYAEEQRFEYDIFMRFRADICNTKMPQLSPIDKNELRLYTIYPLCMFTSFGKHKIPIVSSDWVWGNKKTMAVYCNTYNYVLEQSAKCNGNYLFHFESNHTDCMVDHGVQISYVHIFYNVDLNRKIFDTNWKKDETGQYADSRRVLPQGVHEYIDIKTVKTSDHIAIMPGR